MRLLYVTAGLPFSRSETFIVPEIAELQRRGHDVVIVPVRPYVSVPHADARVLLPHSIVRPLLSGSIVRDALVQCLLSPARTLRCALHLLRSRDWRIFLKNAAVFPKGLWLARLATRTAVDHIHAHWAGTSATMAFVASEVSGIAWSFTAHRWDITENNLIARKSGSAAFTRAIDERGGAELRDLMGPHTSKLAVIHMGVNLPAFAHATARSCTTMRVVMAAFFVEKKGHRYALEAMAQLRRRGIPVRLDLAGDGPLRDQVERDAIALGIADSVAFLGLVSHDELLDGLRSGRWDVALLPSVVSRDGQREGIPVFLMEAMAGGIPVVTTDNGGIPELVEGAGVMVPQCDSTALADALAQLHASEERRHELGERGRKKVHEEFAVGATVTKLLECIHGSRAQAA